MVVSVRLNVVGDKVRETSLQLRSQSLFGNVIARETPVSGANPALFVAGNRVSTIIAFQKQEFWNELVAEFCAFISTTIKRILT